jgi:hypothetical protein
LIAFSSGSIIIGAFAAYVVESPHSDSKIANLGDAFWWAIVTVTTMGDSDIYISTYHRRKNKEQVQVLADELNTVLGSQKLVSMTSSATNGIIVTTIAYEEEEKWEELMRQ